MTFVVRVTLDGETQHVVEWHDAGKVEPIDVAIAVGRAFMRQAKHDLYVEVRRDGEPWDGRRWEIRPAIEAVLR